ncbi:MAG TPA: ABC transporter permease subunit [Acidimicrobiia bacterium]
MAAEPVASTTRRWWWLANGLTLAALGLLVGRPLLELILVGADQLAVGRPGGLDRATAGAALANTIWTGAAVAAVAVTAGTAAAFVTERTAVAGRRVLRITILLPLLVPGFVSALSWARAYGPGGLLDDAVGVSMPGLFGAAGVVAVLAVTAMPVAYLVAVAALRTQAAPDLGRAARVSGARSRTAFLTISLPLLAPAVVGAAALAFIAAINAFGVPAVLGTPAGFRTATTRIYQDLARSAGDEAFSRAVLLALALVLLALVFVVAADRLLSRLGPAPSGGGPAGPVASLSRSGRAASLAVWVVVVVATVLPLVALVLSALTRAVGLPPSPANWTFANLGEALGMRYVGALGRSALLASVAASIVVALGAVVTSIRGRSIGRFSAAAVLLTFAVPGSTLAVAMILAYGNALRDTLVLILVAYVAKLWGVGHRVVAGSASGIAVDPYRAARVSGASPLVAVRTVIEPQMRPALAGAWLLVFVFAFHELTMSSLLYGPGTDTIAVAILDLQQIGDVGVVSALAVYLTLPPLLVATALLIVGRSSASRRAP